MGNFSSKERPPDIDLLPPKFERKAGTLDKYVFTFSSVLFFG